MPGFSQLTQAVNLSNRSVIRREDSIDLPEPPAPVGRKPQPLHKPVVAVGNGDTRGLLDALWKLLWPPNLGGVLP
ncbi:hypothetical protein E4U54_006776, partial [Claviceps lovelessii]